MQLLTSMCACVTFGGLALVSYAVARRTLGHVPIATRWLCTIIAGMVLTTAVFHALLHSVAKTTGAPILAHSTFALRGSPMVRIESDAVAAFLRTELDCLVVEDRMYEPTKTTGLPPRPAMN